MEIESKLSIILIVDDSPEIIKGLNSLLKKDYRVKVALNGEKALKIANSKEPPDLILLDVVMPDLDGYEVCRRLKADQKLKNIPIIFMTSLDKTEDEIKGFKVGAVDYINKPLNPQTVKARIETHLNLKKAHQLIEEQRDNLQEINKQLAQAKENAQAAAKAKSEFLANMSHEIRTPLNAVIAASDLAFGEKITPKIDRFLKIIHSSAYSLMGILNDILDFSKIEAGKMELESAPFILNNMMVKVTDIFITQASEKNIELILDIDTNIPLTLIGDELRLQQVLINLISNALKFTSENGLITIGVSLNSKVLRFDDMDNIVLKFFVKDTGVGMKPQFIDCLFEAFSQEDFSTSRKHGGTGLGLTITKQLVEMMGGKIWVESEYGHGSTFYFTIHIGLQQSKSDDYMLISEDLNGTKILIVDDNDVYSNTTQKVLSSFGYKVETASSGEIALKLLKENALHKEKFELIILDWLMPEMTGIETAQKVREDLNLKIPIILLTGFISELDNEILTRNGINLVLIKPTSPLVLHNSILQVFGKQPQVDFIETNQKLNVSAYKEHLANCQILLAEDNPTNQEIAKYILSQVDIRLTIVNNGKEAIEALYSKPFDAVLMDIQMPEMDGYETTRAIRKDFSFDSLPIIAMTAHATKKDSEKCIKEGMTDFVPKPINQLRLFNILLKHLKNRKPLQNDESIQKTPELILKKPQKKFELSFEKAQKNEKIKKESHFIIPGIDVEYALDNLALNWGTYKKVLIRFYHRNKKIVNSIQDAFNNQNWKELKELVHNLKGSTGNIGAIQLYKNSLKLDKEIKNNADISSIEDLTNNLIKELELVINSISLLPQ